MEKIQTLHNWQTKDLKEDLMKELRQDLKEYVFSIQHGKEFNKALENILKTKDYTDQVDKLDKRVETIKQLRESFLTAREIDKSINLNFGQQGFFGETDLINTVKTKKFDKGLTKFIKNKNYDITSDARFKVKNEFGIDSLWMLENHLDANVQALLSVARVQSYDELSMYIIESVDFDTFIDLEARKHSLQTKEFEEFNI